MLPDPDQLQQFCLRQWDESALPELVEYIRIPNKSPMFDAKWQEKGHMEQAVSQFERWARSQKIADMQLEVVRLPGRTPLLYMDIPGNSDDIVLLYGHLDKQPEMTGWREGLGPWTPVLEGEKLYGRGGADDGYAIFSSLIAIISLQQQAVPHARCVVIIEACEESGSYDLPHYIDALSDRIGSPDLVIWIPAAGTMTSSGARLRYVDWSAVISLSRYWEKASIRVMPVVLYPLHSVFSDSCLTVLTTARAAGFPNRNSRQKSRAKENSRQYWQPKYWAIRFSTNSRLLTVPTR